MPRTGGSRTKQRILEAALRRFGTEGYDATSLDALAGEVGIRKQSVLYHFDSKDGLLAAAALEAAQITFDALDGALRDHDPGGLDRLPIFIAAMDDLAERRPEVLGLIREVARAGPPLSDRVALALEPLVEAAVTWLSNGMAEGILRPQDPRVALLTIYSAAIGHLTESSVQTVLLDDDSRTRARDELVAFLRAGLEP